MRLSPLLPSPPALIPVLSLSDDRRKSGFASSGALSKLCLIRWSHLSLPESYQLNSTSAEPRLITEASILSIKNHETVKPLKDRHNFALHRCVYGDQKLVITSKPSTLDPTL